MPNRRATREGQSMLNALGPSDLAAPSSGVQDSTSVFLQKSKGLLFGEGEDRRTAAS